MAIYNDWLKLLLNGNLMVKYTYTNSDSWVISEWIEISRGTPTFNYYVDYFKAWEQLDVLECNKCIQAPYFRIILESIKYIDPRDGFKSHKILNIDKLYEYTNGLIGIYNSLIFGIIEYSIKHHLQEYFLPIPRTETLEELLQGVDMGYDILELKKRQDLLYNKSFRNNLFISLQRCGINMSNIELNL